MKTRRISRRSMLLLVPAALLPVPAVLAQQGSSFNGAEQMRSTRNVTPLIDQLRVGLRVNRDSQVEFLQLVVAKVEAGELPIAMVNVVYKWAISRNEKYPFPYFQYAMLELAKRRGITFVV